MIDLDGSRILITGGSGFIGANLTKRLIKRFPKSQVIATKHKKFSKIDDHAYPNLTSCTVDLTQEADCRYVVKDIDYIFMCAGNTSGAAVIESSPLVHVTPNILMNTLLLEAAYDAKVKKCLFTSSTVVYPNIEKSMKETDVTGEFFEKYFCAGSAKCFAEALCEMYATKIKNPMSVVIVRPTAAYGPDDDFEWETSHVLPALMRRVVEGHDPLQVWGDGQDVKDFIYIGDLVDGMIAAMQHDALFDIFNLASGIPVTVQNALDIILTLERYQGQIRYDASKPSMIPVRLINPSKAREKLGFTTTTPLETGLQETLSWYKKDISDI